jgi:hypothetical protein
VSGLDPYLYDVDLKTFFTHTFPGYLDFTLKSPLGTVVTISTDNGLSADNALNGTTWDDDADPGNQVPFPGATFAASKLVTDHLFVLNQVEPTLVPRRHWGLPRREPERQWTLTFLDDAGIDTGTSPLVAQPQDAAAFHRDLYDYTNPLGLATNERQHAAADLGEHAARDVADLRHGLADAARPRGAPHGRLAHRQRRPRHHADVAVGDGRDDHVRQRRHARRRLPSDGVE